MPADESLTNSPTSPQTYLIKGDISGIQSFIFNVKSKGAARSLKGRSFFLKLLLELGMQMVFDAYNITDPNEVQKTKISTSGGNFILQLTLDDTTLLDEIQQKFTESLQYTGLNIILAYSKMVDNYQDTLVALNQKARERKYALLENNFSLFEPFDRSEIKLANDNEKWQKVTDQLRKASHFSVVPDNTTTTMALRIFSNSISLAGYQIMFGDSGISLSSYLESIFPTYNNQSVTFEKIAKLGGDYGISKLGVLAMDVDNLGVALEQVSDIEKHKEFDKELQSFFNKQLADIINKTQDKYGEYKYNNRVYVVTAGGDDSFFVGKWNTMLDLAIDIRSAFKKTFKHRPALSISGALVVVDVNFPVVRFASLAEDALKDAKYKYGAVYKGNISLFGEVLDWDILSKEIKKLRSDFKKRKDLISSGLLARARQTAKKIAKEGEGIGLSDFWQMGYFLRNTSATKDKEIGRRILAQFRKYLDKSLDEPHPIKKRSYRLIFAIAARLAEFDHRKN